MASQSKSTNNYEGVMTKTEQRIEKTKGKIRAILHTGINPAEDQVKWMMVRIVTNMFIIVVVDTLLADVNPYIVTMINLIIVWILDPMDSIPMQIVYGKEWCKTRDYVTQDKIGDMTIYMFVLIMHMLLVKTVGAFEIIFIGLYLYRLIGVILNIHTGDDVYLILFPNYFGMNVILYLFLKYVWKVSNTALFVTMAISVPAYTGYEAIHHGWYEKTFI